MPRTTRKPRCKHCGNPQKRNGQTPTGKQRWRCTTCGTSTTKTQPTRTRNHQLTTFLTWLLGKHTQHETSTTSARTLRRNTAWCWNLNPTPTTTGTIHDIVIVDGLYLTKKTCILIAITPTNTVIAWQWCSRESTAAWTALLQQIPDPTVVICDGGTGLTTAIHATWPDTKIQRCTFHIYCQVRTHLTSSPRTSAGKTLLQLARNIMHLHTIADTEKWMQQLNDWHQLHHPLLAEKTYARNSTQKTPYTRYGTSQWWWTHERLRKAYNVLARQVKTRHAFTHLMLPDIRVEPTSNRIEGAINAQLRSLLRHHRGMPLEHQQRAIQWWLYMRTEAPQPPRELIEPHHLHQPPKRPEVTPAPDWRPQEYGTALTAEEGLWARKKQH